MIYTCYEMVQDCRADKPEGWRYFVANYVPVIRKIVAHYGGGLEATLTAMRDPASSLFRSLEPVPERAFVAELRQRILARLTAPEPALPLDLETLAAAWEPLTLVEKQAAWIETFGYDAAQTGTMMRMAPVTVEKMRERAGELLRAGVDSWNRGLLASHARTLGAAAAASGGSECLPSGIFLDILDGRTTWRGRETMEQHVTRCWHCIDHFARMVEVVELVRGVQPLSEVESAPFYRLLGIEAPKRSLWKRWVG